MIYHPGYSFESSFFAEKVNPSSNDSGWYRSFVEWWFRFFNIKLLRRESPSDAWPINGPITLSNFSMQFHIPPQGIGCHPQSSALESWDPKNEIMLEMDFWIKVGKIKMIDFCIFAGFRKNIEGGFLDFCRVQNLHQRRFPLLIRARDHNLRFYNVYPIIQYISIDILQCILLISTISTLYIHWKERWHFQSLPCSGEESATEAKTFCLHPADFLSFVIGKSSR